MPLSRSCARTDADVDRARHHHVPALRVKLETGPDAPGEARAAIATFSEDHGFDTDTLATMMLLVSELVTDAAVSPTLYLDAV